MAKHISEHPLFEQLSSQDMVSLYYGSLNNIAYFAHQIIFSSRRHRR